MSAVFYIDADQVAVLDRVKRRLYDEMTRLGADERRDLANTMDAVLHSVTSYGEADDVAATLDCLRCGHRLALHRRHASGAFRCGSFGCGCERTDAGLEGGGR